MAKELFCVFIALTLPVAEVQTATSMEEAAWDTISFPIPDDGCVEGEACSNLGEHHLVGAVNAAAALPDTVLLQMALRWVPPPQGSAGSNVRHIVAALFVLSCMVAALGVTVCCQLDNSWVATGSTRSEQAFRERFYANDALITQKSGKEPRPRKAPPPTTVVSHMRFRPELVCTVPDGPMMQAASCPAETPMVGKSRREGIVAGSSPTLHHVSIQRLADAQTVPFHKAGGFQRVQALPLDCSKIDSILWVSVSTLLPNRKLGIKLAEDNLELVSFTDARAMQFGFSISDHILQINDMPVSNQLDFLEALQKAMCQLESSGEAMKFKIRRPCLQPSLSSLI
jgi:hypothetical protein